MADNNHSAAAMSFSIDITVSSSDIDAMNHVNNVVYLQWVQDVAEAHWQAITDRQLQQKYKWVVLRHEIDYMSAAFLGQVVVATTWVYNYYGVRSDRMVEFRNKESGKILAKAKTTWCLLDGTTLKPKRVESDIASLFLSSAGGNS